MTSLYPVFLACPLLKGTLIRLLQIISTILTIFKHACFIVCVYFLCKKIMQLDLNPFLLLTFGDYERRDYFKMVWRLIKASYLGWLQLF